jgi:hypothetical protein
VTFDPVPLCIICVRLGPSTPGDYVRARVLVPRNPGVTLYSIETGSEDRQLAVGEVAVWGFGEVTPKESVGY